MLCCFSLSLSKNFTQMAQNPIRKVQIQAKPTRYKKVLRNPKRASEIVSKHINKKVLKHLEVECKLSSLKKS